MSVSIKLVSLVFEISYIIWISILYLLRQTDMSRIKNKCLILTIYGFNGPTAGKDSEKAHAVNMFIETMMFEMSESCIRPT